MKKISIVALVLILVSLAVFSSCSASMPTGKPPPQTTTAGTYRPPTTQAPVTTRPPIITTAAPTMTRPPMTTSAPTTKTNVPAPTSTGTIGLAAGGAKDISNFRENLRNNYLPIPTDVTYEGLFYDYYFDTGASGPANKLFSPSYASAVTRDPLSGQTDYYISVGLNSGLRESNFQRKKLNLVILLDNSGSMSDAYNQYYYDFNGKQIDAYAEEGIHRLSKMVSADEAVVSILDQLNGDDRLSIVTFNSTAYLYKPMGLVSQIDLGRIKDGVLNINAGGSTNLDAGLDAATRQFHNLYEINNYEYENRIIVLTDAQPNTGDISSYGLLNTVSTNAANRIYTTFIGIGVDFNSNLIDQISKIKGANYYSVHSPRQFRERVQDEFEYMVTPLIFNVQLNFQSTGWRIEKVFGSPEADASSGRLMHINTLFAAKSEGGENRGGLVLLKLRKISAGNADIYLSTTYEDRDGSVDGDRQVIRLETIQPEYFDNTGIRKGVLLTRYAALLKNWMTDELNHLHYSQPWTPCIREDTGIVIPVELGSQWERQSVPLDVSPFYQVIFLNFSRHYASEMDAIGDRTLGQELDLLNLLSRY